MTRAHTKKAREALNQIVTTIIEAKPTIHGGQNGQLHQTLGRWVGHTPCFSFYLVLCL